MSYLLSWRWVLGAPSRRAAGRGPPGHEHVRGCRAWGRARVVVGQFCLRDRCAHAGQTRPRRDTRDATRSLHDLFTVTLKTDDSAAGVATPEPSSATLPSARTENPCAEVCTAHAGGRSRLPDAALPARCSANQMLASGRASLAGRPSPPQ